MVLALFETFHVYQIIYLYKLTVHIYTYHYMQLWALISQEIDYDYQF